MGDDVRSYGRTWLIAAGISCVLLVFVAWMWQWPDGNEVQMTGEGEASSQPAVEKVVMTPEIKDIVMDLGILLWDDPAVNYRLKDIGRWQSMSRHLKLLQIIEEGRREPKQMVTLLEAEIARSLDGLEQVQSGCMSVMASMLEYDRRHKSAYAAFYVLANIGERMSPSLLAKWIEVKRPPMADAKDMHIWLIHQYFQQAKAHYPTEAGKHDALAANMGLSSDVRTITRRNGSWDVDNPLIKAKDVDVSGIPTIEVLSIPPRALKADAATKDAIIANFLSHVRRLDQ